MDNILLKINTLVKTNMSSKTTMVVAFYILLTVGLAVLGYATNGLANGVPAKFCETVGLPATLCGSLKVPANLCTLVGLPSNWRGAGLGAVVGVVVSAVLWKTVGEKMVKAQ